MNWKARLKRIETAIDKQSVSASPTGDVESDAIVHLLSKLSLEAKKELLAAVRSAKEALGISDMSGRFALLELRPYMSPERFTDIVTTLTTKPIEAVGSLGP